MPGGGPVMGQLLRARRSVLQSLESGGDHYVKRTLTFEAELLPDCRPRQLVTEAVTRGETGFRDDEIEMFCTAEHFGRVLGRNARTLGQQIDVETIP
jgi:hypothetical protein